MKNCFVMLFLHVLLIGHKSGMFSWCQVYHIQLTRSSSPSCKLYITKHFRSHTVCCKQYV